MAGGTKIRQTVFISALFCALGLFSYFLLINFGEPSFSKNEKLASPLAVIFAMVVFNILGFSIIRLSHRIETIILPYQLRRMRLLISYSLVALTLLLINYAILVSAKILISAPNPFIFPNGGLVILIAVWLIEMIVVSLLLANRSTKRAFELQRKAARLQLESDNAKYEALQNQLNPHFLFNSLNTLISEIEYNPESAVRFTRKLSDVYRYVLQCQQQRTVSLADEILFLESYIYLHRVRLGDCIVIDNRVTEGTDYIKVAPLTLQLLAENVVKHNIITEENIMHIILDITTDKNFMIVSNKLIPKLSDAVTGIGLKNLSNRYLLLCGKDIEVCRGNGMFEVKIPLLYE